MFIRKKINVSGSQSVQVIQKVRGKYKVIKTIGCATKLHEIEKLEDQARQEIERLTSQPKLFQSELDHTVDRFVDSLRNADIRTIGPELVFGKIYDAIGFNQIGEEFFRHLVIARLSFPLSKLKTIDYLYRYQGVGLNIDSVYRFLDKLNNKLKGQIEQIAYAHTLKVLDDNISVVFYDMTTLYFEASDEDDLRKTGFSKDGKHQNPQIFIGLLVGMGGYAIGYDIFEGNTYEGHTLVPFLEKISQKFNLYKPVVVADAGLLNKDNISSLESQGHEYILGARLKNETKEVKEKILGNTFTDNMAISIEKDKKTRLIVHYSGKRAKKDAHNRERGLKRLEKRVQTGKLTKANINNRGYNKYLKLEGDISIEVDYEKYKNDCQWDGLKGYITNTSLTQEQVMENYKNLWHIEKAFRMSKTDLRVRPIYHRLRHRIEAHLCIAFTAYCIYKELERVLYESKSSISLKKAAEITHNIYQLNYMLPDSKHIRSQLLKMDQDQSDLCKIINENF